MRKNLSRKWGKEDTFESQAMKKGVNLKKGKFFFIRKLSSMDSAGRTPRVVYLTLIGAAVARMVKYNDIYCIYPSLATVPNKYLGLTLSNLKEECQKGKDNNVTYDNLNNKDQKLVQGVITDPRFKNLDWKGLMKTSAGIKDSTMTKAQILRKYKNEQK